LHSEGRVEAAALTGEWIEARKEVNRMKYVQGRFHDGAGVGVMRFLEKEKVPA